MKIREAKVAGKFYPASAQEIINQLNEIKEKEKKAIAYDLANHHIAGGIVPHAGHMFSGYEAVHFFEILNRVKVKPETIVIINPNHTGIGVELAIDNHEKWKTPLGEIDLDTELRDILPFPGSSREQEYEHSAEVMVPFIQHFLDYPVSILPITMSVQNYKYASALAAAIKEAAEKIDREIILIASSDFSHFLTPEKGYELDQLVVDAIMEQDPIAVEHVVRKNNISVCGFGPIMTLMEYAKLIDAKEIKILKQGHSGEVIPSNEVVDYLSILFFKKL